MTLEMAVVVVGLGLIGLLAWRETRIRRVSKLSKSHKTLLRRLDKLEAELSGVPGAEDLGSIEEKLREIEAKATAAAPGQMKIIVDRVNQVSNDTSALKILVDDVKNRLVRLETGSSWSKIVKKEG